MKCVLVILLLNNIEWALFISTMILGSLIGTPVFMLDSSSDKFINIWPASFLFTIQNLFNAAVDNITLPPFQKYL